MSPRPPFIHGSAAPRPCEDREAVLKPESPRRCVLLFARSPRAEAAVKGLRGGEELFRLSARRVAEAVMALPGVDLVPVPPRAQSGLSFGERLEGAFLGAQKAGYREIVVVPGDVPDLSADDLGAAFDALAFRGAALGPTRDGGVWLIGLDAVRNAPSDALRGVPWRTAGVFEALVRNVPDAALLSARRDVNGRTDGVRVLRAARASGDAVLAEALVPLFGGAARIPARAVPLPAEGRPPAPASARAPPFSRLAA